MRHLLILIYNKFLCDLHGVLSFICRIADCIDAPEMDLRPFRHQFVLYRCNHGQVLVYG